MNDSNRKCNKEGKRYIYAYDDEPDYTMHNYGPDHDKVKELIKIRNDKVEKMCNELEDTIVFITANHGYVRKNNIIRTKSSIF